MAGTRSTPPARIAWQTLLERDERLITTSYVLVETFALVQNRLGMEAVRVLADDVVPVLHVQWVGEHDHRLGVTALVAAGRRQLSLVDRVSFATMRELQMDTAFAFDRDFADQGFRTLP